MKEETVRHKPRSGQKQPPRTKPPQQRPPQDDDDMPATADLIPKAMQLTQEETARFHRLTILWVDIYSFTNKSFPRNDVWANSEELRENLAARLTRYLEQLKREYPDVKADPVPNAPGLLSSSRQVAHARRLLETTRAQRLPDTPEVVAAREDVRVSEAVLGVFAMLKEMTGLLGALTKHKDPVHLLAARVASGLFQRIAHTATTLQPPDPAQAEAAAAAETEAGA